MREVYEEKGTLKAAAGHLGISPRSLSKYLRKAGVDIKVGARKGTAQKVHHHSCFAKWLRENKGTPLPRNVNRIAEMTGCSRNAVSSYLKRRRDGLIREVHEILNALTGENTVIYDLYQRKLPLRSVESFNIFVDRFSQGIQVNFHVKPFGKVTFFFDIELLRSFQSGEK
jgi:predicted transcriptional regulator